MDSQGTMGNVGGASSGDPLALARRIRKRVTDCACGSGQLLEDISYLWIYVSRDGLPRPINDTTGATTLSRDEWLNVIDEAATLGVQWLVVSVRAPLGEVNDVWAICEWAQAAHGMTVGLHTESYGLSDAEKERLLTMDTSKLRLLIRSDALPHFRELEARGVRVCVADTPADHEHRSDTCHKPGKMVFVDPQGVLYTCGMVQGDDEFRLGSVFSGTLTGILHDPGLPHAVPEPKRQRHAGCEGCPPLVAPYFAQD